MATAAASKFKRIRNVTEQVLKLKPNQTRFVYIGTPMFQGRKIDDKKEAAILARAVDMETGEEGVMMCSAVIRNELAANYPKNGYVGKGFEVTVTRAADRAEGELWNHVAMSEVSVPEDFTPPTFTMPDPAAVKAAEDVLAAAAAKRAAGNKPAK